VVHVRQLLNALTTVLFVEVSGVRVLVLHLVRLPVIAPLMLMGACCVLIIFVLDQRVVPLHARTTLIVSPTSMAVPSVSGTGVLPVDATPFVITLPIVLVRATAPSAMVGSPAVMVSVLARVEARAMQPASATVLSPTAGCAMPENVLLPVYAG